MAALLHLVVFALDDRRFALPLEQVEWVCRAVEVTPLPGAPGVVLGVVNVHGDLLPVIDVRVRFGQASRPVAPDDSFLVVHTDRRQLILVVDDCEGVVEHPREAVVLSETIAPGVERFPGMVDLNGLVLIHDLDRLLSMDETRALDAALDGAASPQEPPA